MAQFQNVRTLTALVAITSGTPAAVVNRFAVLADSPTEDGEIVTQVPGANGAPAQGIVAMKPDADSIKDGIVATTLALPGGIALVEFGEDVAHGDAIRVGGNGGEVDGAGYLADATGDVIVGYAAGTYTAGAVGSLFFTGFSGEVA